jgi:hypothetical protein
MAAVSTAILWCKTDKMNYSKRHAWHKSCRFGKGSPPPGSATFGESQFQRTS